MKKVKLKERQKLLKNMKKEYRLLCESSEFRVMQPNDKCTDETVAEMFEFHNNRGVKDVTPNRNSSLCSLLSRLQRFNAT